VDPAYGFDSTLWGPRCHFRFLDDDEFKYGPLVNACVKVDAEVESSMLQRDDIDDYLGYLTYLAEKAKEEGTKDQLYVISEGMDEEDVLRLDMKASKVQLKPSA
jgi:hypothetical protein